MQPLIIDEKIEESIRISLKEDLGSLGDITSDWLLPAAATAQARIIAKAPGVIAGITIAERVFQLVDNGLRFENMVADSTKVKAADLILKVAGSAGSILTAERTALNFLQRMSGIATLTNQFVEKVSGTGAKILDTRKTTPGLRTLEKYAVRAGGGHNHRMGLSDMILIKENHIAAAGGLSKAVGRIRGQMQKRNLKLAVEVEARTIEEVREAVALRVDRIMLDNMLPTQIREAVKIVGRTVELEASGGVTLEIVREIAETGVDYISVGALTHSAKALDLSLLLK